MKNKPEVIAVANQKGGVGKTTTTVTLAGLLAERGHNTLVVDLDPHGSLTSYFGYDPETIKHGVFNLYQNIAANKRPDTDSVIKTTAFDHLSILPASTALATLEKQLGGRNGMGLVLSRSLSQMQQAFDFIIIDCPPMLGMLMINALACCEQLIIPVQTEYLAIKGLQRMMRTLKMIERSLKTQINYHVLPTMYDKRTNASKQCLQQLKSENEEHITATVIPVDTRFRDASHVGKPISMMAGKTRGAQAYLDFLTEMGVSFNNEKISARDDEVLNTEASVEMEEIMPQNVSGQVI